MMRVIQEVCLKRDQLKIYGKLYLPDKKETPYPLVIMSHGFATTHKSLEFYAQEVCQTGYAVYIYDFCGGSKESRSDGSFADMSVLSEAADLLAVIEQLQAHPDIDSNRIYLMGASQGGFVSAYVASKIPEAIAGLILFYPAFVLQDDAKKRLEMYGNTLKAREVMGMQIGERYNQDALSFDIFDKLTYPTPVLIVHGDSDSIVPWEYSKRAQETFPQADLVLLSGAGHGFRGEKAKVASRALLDYLAEQEKGRNL